MADGAEEVFQGVPVRVDVVCCLQVGEEVVGLGQCGGEGEPVSVAIEVFNLLESTLDVGPGAQPSGYGLLEERVDCVGEEGVALCVWNVEDVLFCFYEGGGRLRPSGQAMIELGLHGPMVM